MRGSSWGEQRVMAKPAQAAFDRDLARDVEDPEFRTSYEATRARIDAIDTIINQLDDAREFPALGTRRLDRYCGADSGLSGVGDCVVDGPGSVEFCP